MSVIANGTISAKVKTGGGFDGNGNPIPVRDMWTSPIPCNIQANTKSEVGRVNGNTFTMAAYSVIIDEQPFEASRVMLTQSGVELGEFAVLNVELLSRVGRIKILVSCPGVR